MSIDPAEALRGFIDALSGLKAPRFRPDNEPEAFDAARHHLKMVAALFDTYVTAIGEAVADNARCVVDPNAFSGLAREAICWADDEIYGAAEAERDWCREHRATQGRGYDHRAGE